jgi:hypothetical protein
MRPVVFLGLTAVAVCLAFSSPALAGGPDPADYPLRVHILKSTAQPRHSREGKHWSDAPDYVDGMGVANLFENGQPRGFQFSYSCIANLQPSSGYGTYPARWKKREKTLEILLPESGKPWNLQACQLQAGMRPGLAFCWRNGLVAEESAALLKDWMVKHQYNPEMGKDDPILSAGDAAGAGDPGTND